MKLKPRKFDYSVPLDKAKERGEITATLLEMKKGATLLVPIDEVGSWRSVAQLHRIKIKTQRDSETHHRIWRK